MSSLQAEGAVSELILSQPENDQARMLETTNGLTVPADVMSDEDVPITALLVNNRRGMRNGNVADQAAEERDAEDILDITDSADGRTDSGNDGRSVDERPGHPSLDEMDFDFFSPSNVPRASMAVKISAGNIMDLMQISGDDKGKIGLRKLRDKKLDQLQALERKTVVRVVKNVYFRAAYSFLPSDGSRLMGAVFDDCGFSSMFTKRLSGCLKKCQKKSLEKRLIRAVIYGIIGGELATEMISGDVKKSTVSRRGESVDDDDLAPSEDDDSGDECSTDGEQSASRREANNGSELRKRMNGMKWSGNVRRIMDRAQNDWHQLLDDGKIVRAQRRVKRVSKECLMECLSFIFSREHRQLMAHGTKRIKTQDGDTFFFPKICRTKSKRGVARAYVEWKEERQGTEKICRRSVMEILRVVTSGQQCIKQCVDYCLAVLVFENIRTLKRIVHERAEDVTQRKQLGEQLEAVGDYLKHGYCLHIGKDGDCVHDSYFGLVGLPMGAARSGSTNTQSLSSVTTCDDCLKPFQCVENIRAAVDESKDGLKEVLDDASQKFKLFLGHAMRCHVQHLAFDEVQERMLGSTAELFGIVTMDYKMKFEPKHYRQKSSDWYGRKGLSWHGTVVTFKKKRTPEDGRPVSNQVELKNFYFDHVCRNSTEQSSYAVCSILEMVCRLIAQEIPSMRVITIETDNAKTYSNDLLPVMAPFICAKYGLRLSSIVHNETCDGKGPADVHFATAMRHVDRYIEEHQMDVVTPRDLVDAINHGNGMKGCIGELYDIHTDCEQYEKWVTNAKKDGSLAKLGRINIIEYDEDRSAVGKYYARTFVYKHSEPVKWILEEGKSELQSGQSPAAQPEAALTECHPSAGDGTVELGEEEEEDNMGLVDDTGIILNEAEGNVDVSELILDDGAFVSSDPNGEEAPNETEGTGIVFDDFGLRLHHVFSGDVTGVRVVSSGYVKRVALLSKDLESMRRGVEYREEANPEENSDDEEPSRQIFKEHGNCLLCGKCGHSFHNEDAVREHYVTCKVSASSVLLVDRAARLAKYLVERNVIPVVRHATENPTLKSMTISDEVRQRTTFGPFWATRPARGATLGSTFMDAFREEIKKMVEIGNNDKGKRMSSDQMQERLRVLHPSRYDIPSAHHIGQCINSTRAALKRADDRESGTGHATARYFMPAVYATALEELITTNRQLMPGDAEGELVKKLAIDNTERPHDFPPTDKIKQKVSSLKQKLNKGGK